VASAASTTATTPTAPAAGRPTGLSLSPPDDASIIQLGKHRGIRLASASDHMLRGYAHLLIDSQPRGADLAHVTTARLRAVEDEQFKRIAVARSRRHLFNR
jgi:hypothetical protein